MHLELPRRKSVLKVKLVTYAGFQAERLPVARKLQLSRNKVHRPLLEEACHPYLLSFLWQ